MLSFPNEPRESRQVMPSPSGSVPLPDLVQLRGIHSVRVDFSRGV